jgi:hypothetical protein
MQNVRRIHYWGFHNNDPAQLFRSSVSYTQCMETPPGELPVFLAYKLNGRPIPLVRGGPVRMVVPWSHGYKSIKWLQQIVVTNDARNNDTYAQGNNDPDSTLKTAAYLDEVPTKLDARSPLRLSGQVICGPSGVQRVECWVRRLEGEPRPLADDDPELLRGPWIPCELAPPPDWDSILPEGIAPTQLLGFRRDTGQPLSWPLKFGTCSFSAVVRDLTAGHYEVRARAIDLNGFAQPEPRPAQKNGRTCLPPAFTVRGFSGRAGAARRVGAGQMARGLRRMVAIRRQAEGPLRRQGLRDAGAVCGGEPFQGVVAALS